MQLSRYFRTKRAKAAGAAVLAALGLATALVGGSSPADADPRQLDQAFVGVGSDTTQDVMNALAGEANGLLYNPVRATAAAGTSGRQLISFDAVGSACVTPRAPGASFDRPNGSSRGREALSAAYKAGSPGWDRAEVGCTSAPKNVSGLIDFARSSSGVTTTTGELTYIPFGRDALGYAYYTPSGVTPVTTLTGAQLTTLHNAPNAVITVGSTRIIACRIQQGSGTFQFWNTKIGNPTQSALDAATSECPVNAGINGLQENDASALKAAGDAVNAARPSPDTQVVIGFSAANFISQKNGIAKSQFPTLGAGQALDLGIIDQAGVPLNKPYDGASAPFSPNSAFYNSTYGRAVFNVLPTTIATGIGNPAPKSMFVGAGSSVCSATAQVTVNLFGFLSVPDCGSTTNKGPFLP